jgi:hypothetical protein
VTDGVHAWEYINIIVHIIRMSTALVRWKGESERRRVVNICVRIRYDCT